jgi:NAD(P)-dependent dehydrogenase (short-subunit alcohol dehydrogenase family)
MVNTEDKSMNENPVAVVTGGNRGMGLPSCRALAEAGFHVLLASRELEAGKRAARPLCDEGLSVEAVKLEMTSQADIDALASYLKSTHDRVDVLINNAGILIDGDLDHPTSICDADVEVIRKTLEVNAIGPIMLTSALLPLMRQANYGRIVNISSGMGQLADMGGQHPGYRISKTALNAATRIFAAELEGSNITVNSVCPGWVRTDMGGANADRSVEQGIDTAIWLATSSDTRLTGGYYRDRKLIDW